MQENSKVLISNIIQGQNLLSQNISLMQGKILKTNEKKIALILAWPILIIFRLDPDDLIVLNFTKKALFFWKIIFWNQTYHHLIFTLWYKEIERKISKLIEKTLWV